MMGISRTTQPLPVIRGQLRLIQRGCRSGKTNSGLPDLFLYQRGQDVDVVLADEAGAKDKEDRIRQNRFYVYLHESSAD